MSFLTALVALGLLMLVAYRGFSVILFAPVCALLAVVLTHPTPVLPYLQRRLHGKDGGLHQTLPAGFPPRRSVREGDRALRIRALDRHGGDWPGWAGPRPAVDRAGGCPAHLR